MASIAETASPGGPTSVQYSLQGNLIFDNGLPAAGITARLYNIGFAGQDTKLGETKSDAEGKYTFSFSPAQGSLPNLQVRVVHAPGACSAACR